MVPTMAATPYPLPRETRETDTLVGNGTAGPYGPTLFRVFDTADVEVWAKALGADDFTPAVGVSVNKTAALPYDTVSVTFAAPVPVTTQFRIAARRTHSRDVAVSKAGSLTTAELEKELSKQGSVISELRRDVNRGGAPVAGVEGQVLVFDANLRTRPGPTAIDIENAQGYAAEAKAAAALVAASGYAAVFATRTVAAAYVPPSASFSPSYLETLGYAAVGDLGRTLFKKVGAPADLALAATNGDTVHYQNVSDVLRPEQFGPIGTSAALDTAAWVLLVACANARGGILKVRLDGPAYLLNATATASDSQTFTNFTSLRIRLAAETAVRSQLSLTKTFKAILPTGASFKVTGGTLYGFAQKEIDAGALPGLTLTEGTFAFFNGGSGNAVAAIYTEGRGSVEIRRVKTRNHCGRDLHVRGAESVEIVECDLSGVGGSYNRPVTDGHQGNGEDAAIYVVPVSQAASGTAWVCRLTIQGGRIGGHSFGWRTVQLAELKISGVTFFATPGQYAGYDSDSDYPQIQNNRFENTRLNAIKFQMENRAGLNYGTAWATATVYALGDPVRASSTLYICTTAHTSTGGAIDLSKFAVHPRYRRRGGIVSGNIYTACDGALAAVFNSATNGRDIWWDGLIVANETLIDCTGTLFQLLRCRNLTFTGNKSNGGGIIGFFGADISGTVAGNDLRGTTKQAYLTSIADHTVIKDNVAWDAGLSGSNNQERAPFAIYERDAVNDPPTFAANPTVFLKNNGIVFTSGDAAGDYISRVTDARLAVDISGTYGTPTTKPFDCAGTLVRANDNHFPGFVSGDNPSAAVAGSRPRNFFASQDPASAGDTRPYRVGDRVWKSNVAAAGVPGWICTTAGSPGTWKAMAAVAA